MRNRGERGVALITTLLVLMLVSSMMVGLTWLVLSGQQLGGTTGDRDKAFYGAESGLESMTAAMMDRFALSNGLSAADVNTIMTNPPVDIGGIQFLNPDGTNGYMIKFTPDNFGNPLAANRTITSGNYAGLTGLLTPFTLKVTARSAGGSEATLQREIQTVAIPVFQFGMFCDTDCSFFAGPNFNFGGRVHTNGNLWLAEGNGSTLTMGDKVTAVGQIIRTNLANGWPTNNNYTGTVDVTLNPGSGNYRALGPNEGSTIGNSVVGAISPTKNEPAFANLANGTYNADIGNADSSGVKRLDLSIAIPSIGGQPIDLIRRPQPGENVANPGKLATRYYDEASIRILLSDYGPSGTCADSEINVLPALSLNPGGVPVDLATLSWDASAPLSAGGNAALPYSAAPAWIPAASIGTSVFPLPTSGATSTTTYNAANGFWVVRQYPVITGCIKIDYQNLAGTAWIDITQAALLQGYTGRNLNPIAGVAPPNRGALPGGQVAPSNCPDPSRTAIIRLARVRDNPSGTFAGGPCGAPPVAAGNQRGSDYWPNVLYDTRESLLRDNALAGDATDPNGQLTAAGAMSYVELDVNNLAAYIRANANVINNSTGGYTIYFSDRRGNVPDPTPPASVGPGVLKTAAFGYEDYVNLNNPLTGCPNNALDQGEDVESDYSLGNSTNVSPLPRVYGNVLANLNPVTNPSNPKWLWPLLNTAPAAVLPGGVQITGTELGGLVTPAAQQVSNLVNGGVPAGTPAILAANPTCPGAGNTWPFAVAANGQDLRENPPIFFRRALKIVNGQAIALGVCNGAIPCGLTIASENPVYVQGDYNALANGNFGGAHMAASVIADAVTLLSNNWNDVNSFAFPYNTGNRTATTTTYRLAIASGKGIAFPQPPGTAQDFGTDGGTHNFLRYIENWGGSTLWYRGSIVSFFFNHQAVGLYKCCNTVYSPPTRGYNFDTEFLTPSLLPPRTPLFRDINSVGFTQIINPAPPY
ncbi:MAG TPA: pilus assembly PilX N-terminal domain-containing protein [Candidatus Acidoferrales bacterium]|nr:pilus assembly PilX N-terminal domain-containing protein [Candidatus Acidoferrales bacterium]